ncbi:hypothetical protein TorRG33x02_126300 [Trema orientale]|uniref:Uncharacterized protein n=2 Tax=Cannabaceae TaxID=3481 RepID=A0A2P5F1D1_TREOI|nr:hypothetical protein TorRG33x02_126300 [Trema orientale]
MIRGGRVEKLCPVSVDQCNWLGKCKVQNESDPTAQIFSTWRHNCAAILRTQAGWDTKARGRHSRLYVGTKA